MAASKTMPKFKSLEELVEFCETTDLGDYLDSMPEVEFDIDLQRRTYSLTVDKDLAVRLSDLSRRMGIPEETLIRSWLWEKVTEQA